MGTLQVIAIAAEPELVSIFCSPSNRVLGLLQVPSFPVGGGGFIGGRWISGGFLILLIPRACPTRQIQTKASQRLRERSYPMYTAAYIYPRFSGPSQSQGLEKGISE
jgi:hypothetical protein